MVPKENTFKCKCGLVKKITKDLADKYAVSEKLDTEDTVIFTGEDINTTYHQSNL